MNEIRFFGEYTFENAPMVLMRGIEIIDLPPRQLETLSLLLEAHGEVVSRERFLDTVWKDVVVEEHNLTQTIFLLRRTLGKLPDGGEYIETVPKTGYRLSPAALHRDDISSAQDPGVTMTQHDLEQIIPFSDEVSSPERMSLTNIVLIGVCLALVMAVIAAIELLRQQPRLLSVQQEIRDELHISMTPKLLSSGKSDAWKTIVLEYS